MGLLFSEIPELEGTNTEIALANLSSLENELGEVFERRIAHLCELAFSIIKDGGDIDLIKSILVSIRSDGELNVKYAIRDNISYLNSLFSEISIVERIIIFKQLFDKIPQERFFPSNDAAHNLPFDAVGRIAYIQNSYNDMVFEHFSDLIKDVKASYYGSVSDVCESVVNCHCQFCILPIETAKDGKLASFYEQILKHGLKINAEYDLYNKGGSDYTRYALLATDFSLPNQIIAKKKNTYLQIAYSDMENISLKELLTSSELFGFKLESVETLIFNDGKFFCLELCADDADIRTFLSYLSVDCPEYTFVGLYPKI